MDFIKGADISSLQAMEENGADYYDLDGKRKDAVAILKNHGVNAVRLRIWNDPKTSFDRGDYCDLKHTLVMAKRVKDAGMKLLLDFHYSDTWADWKQQQIPEAWRGQSREELAASVYAYTRQVLSELDRAGAYPELVQIGNEIGCGLLWEYGRTEHPETLALFLNQGIRAVRDTQTKARRAKVVLHIECGGDVRRTERFFETLEAHGVLDYDVIGLSYYPYWAGAYEKFAENMKNLAEKFPKPVMVIETAFPYTDEADDGAEVLVDSKLTLGTLGLSASVENQRRVTENVISLVRGEKNGCGVFYWEPVWYSKKGVGAVKGSGNEWSNQAMFDKKGRALDSIRAFER